MYSENVTLVNPQGFHMRPVSELVKMMSGFSSKVSIVHNGKEVPANSLMALMAEGIKCGETIEVRADGADEQDAVKKAVEFIGSGMGD